MNDVAERGRGERLDETTSQGYSLPAATSRLVHVHQDPAVLGVHQRADLAIIADPADLCTRLVAIADEVRPSPGRLWWHDGHEAYLRLAASAAAIDPQNRLHPGRVIEAVQSVAAPGTVVVNDAGNFSVYLHRQWIFREPHTQAAPICGAMGTPFPVRSVQRLRARTAQYLP